MKQITFSEMKDVQGGLMDLRFMMCITSKMLFDNRNAWIQCLQ